MERIPALLPRIALVTLLPRIALITLLPRILLFFQHARILLFFQHARILLSVPHTHFSELLLSHSERPLLDEEGHIRMDEEESRLEKGVKNNTHQSAGQHDSKTTNN
ncbi:hypothetical protein BLNAU_19896 [Blattamonas nauphoetae]|uniref:Uncharacterized protein n=1 Tax=Blattamonas nauphoetae TaxID=2049346 RepID=A0ABQ9X2P9_9EUKA|nr:hypothetical protein BLNAU_19896 [Blattamonas nauphoetae]